MIEQQWFTGKARTEQIRRDLIQGILSPLSLGLLLLDRSLVWGLGLGD